MKFSQVAVLLVGSFAFAGAGSAQAPAISEGETPVFAEANPVASMTNLFDGQAQPGPPSPFLSPQGEIPDSLAIEDRYRAEIELLAQNEHQFVHCKLKNGKVLTGRLAVPGGGKFAIRTNALGEGTIVEYNALAESPRAVPAVGTRIKQGAQWTGFVIFVIVFFIPLAITGVIPSC